VFFPTVKKKKLFHFQEIFFLKSFFFIINGESHLISDTQHIDPDDYQCVDDTRCPYL